MFLLRPVTLPLPFELIESTSISVEKMFVLFASFEHWALSITPKYSISQFVDFWLFIFSFHFQKDSMIYGNMCWRLSKSFVFNVVKQAVSWCYATKRHIFIYFSKRSLDLKKKNGWVLYDCQRFVIENRSCTRIKKKNMSNIHRKAAEM